MKQVDELRNVLNKYLPWNKARLTCFCQMIIALFMVRSVNLTQIVTAFQGKASLEPHYKRLRRFFAGFNFDMTCVLEMILQMFPIEGKVWLIIDRTNWQFGLKHINILTFAIAYKGIAIPISWSVMAKAGNSFTDDRIKLLERVTSILKRAKIKGLIADREFIGSKWFDYLIKNRIPFYIRIKEDTMAEGVRDGYAIPLKDVFRQVKEGKRKTLTHPIRLLGQTVYVAASRLKNELLIVVTNRDPKKALSFYKIRWEIETLFACLKTRGFCFEATHLTHPERIEKLVLVLCIAFCWSYRIGDIANQIKPIVIKKHGRRAKSLFRLGMDKIRRTLFEKGLDPFLWLIKAFDLKLLTTSPQEIFL
jgi:hypothetical protein